MNIISLKYWVELDFTSSVFGLVGCVWISSLAFLSAGGAGDLVTVAG